MGIFSRFSDIVNSNINAILDKAEDLEKLNDDIVRLEEKLVDAKTRQQAISARHSTAARHLEARKRLHSYRIDDAFIKFDQFERRIDDLEAHAESYDLGVKKDLKD